MNILFCNYEYPPLGGGGGVVNAWLAESIANDHDVTVLTSSAYGLPEQETINGVNIIRVPVYFRNQMQAANMPSMAAFVINAKRKGKQLIKNNKFDIINTHFVLPTGPVGAKLAKFADIPNVLSVHGGDLYDPSKRSSPHRHAPLRSAVRKLLHAADAVVGQSKNTIANVHNLYDKNISCDRIPLGIPRVNYPTANRQAWGIGPEKIVLITIGRLVERKAVNQLIEIMKQSERTDLHLIVVGDGPKMADLKDLTAAFKLQDCIQFAGQVTDDEKLQLLACADLYVSTSQHEGFGLVFLEGMAAGLPVICYNHGGQTDFIENQQHGFLVELNDKTTLAEHVYTLAENADLRRNMSQNCLQTVENYFIDNCAQQYISLFQRCLKSR